MVDSFKNHVWKNYKKKVISLYYFKKKIVFSWYVLLIFLPVSPGAMLALVHGDQMNPPK